MQNNHSYVDLSDLNAQYDQMAIQGLGGGSLGTNSLGAVAAFQWGQYSKAVLSLQNSINLRLPALGYWPIVEDGILGPKTCGATRIVYPNNVPTACQSFTDPLPAGQTASQERVAPPSITETSAASAPAPPRLQTWPECLDRSSYDDLTACLISPAAAAHPDCFVDPPGHTWEELLAIPPCRGASRQLPQEDTAQDPFTQSRREDSKSVTGGGLNPWMIAGGVAVVGLGAWAVLRK